MLPYVVLLTKCWSQAVRAFWASSSLRSSKYKALIMRLFLILARDQSNHKNELSIISKHSCSGLGLSPLQLYWQRQMVTLNGFDAVEKKSKRFCKKCTSEKKISSTAEQLKKEELLHLKKAWWKKLKKCELASSHLS